MTTLEDHLAAFLKMPGTFITHREQIFIRHMREAAAEGVGYGWMQQVIEWEWQSKDPNGAFGPTWYQAQVQKLRDQLTVMQSERDFANDELYKLQCRDRA
jgi:hypothetical protein